MTSTVRTAATDRAGATAAPRAAAAAAHHQPAVTDAAASPASDRQAEYRTLMRKWWFAAAVGVPTMVLSYPWLFPGLRDLFSRGSAALWWLWVAMGIASLAVLVYSGGQFFTGAWEALKHRSANMHTLIAIGTGTAWMYSSVALLFAQLFPSAAMTDVYYDVTVVVTALVVLGMAMEVKARGRTSEAIEKLIGLAPKTARVIRDRVAVDEVVLGDVVVVRPGAKIPVDGVIVEGASTVDESMITLVPPRGDSRLLGAGPPAGLRQVRRAPDRAGGADRVHARRGWHPRVHLPDGHAARADRGGGSLMTELTLIDSRQAPAARCLVCGNDIQTGEGVVTQYGERVLRFKCQGCYARFRADPEPYLAGHTGGCCGDEHADAQAPGSAVDGDERSLDESPCSEWALY